MSKSKRNRRTGGRTTPKGKPGTLVSQMFGETYQKSGALGLLLIVAEFNGRCENRNDEDEGSRTTGESFVRVLAADQGKLAADALAATAQVWADETIRSVAKEASIARERQMAGLFRTLDETSLVDGWRVTDEYADSEVLLFELAIGGRDTLTLSASTNNYEHGWIELSLLNASAREATEFFVAPEQPGNPRKICEQLSVARLRFEAWLLSANRRVDSENPAAPIIFAWLARMLDVDSEFPAIPDFSGLDDESDDEYLDVAEELDTFLKGDTGRPWSTEPYELLVDHLSDHESGRSTMKWSPARVEDFLLHRSHFGVDGLYALPALLRSWVKHCATTHRQRKPLLRAVLAEIDLCEPEFFAKHTDSLAA